MNTRFILAAAAAAAALFNLSSAAQARAYPRGAHHRTVAHHTRHTGKILAMSHKKHMMSSHKALGGTKAVGTPTDLTGGGGPTGGAGPMGGPAGTGTLGTGTTTR